MKGTKMKNILPGISMAVLITLLAALFSIYFVFFYMPALEQEAIENNEVCEGINKYGSMAAISNEYNCCVDCHKLNMNYFRYEFNSGMFSATIRNCYCLDGNESKQIW